MTQQAAVALVMWIEAQYGHDMMVARMIRGHGDTDWSVEATETYSGESRMVADIWEASALYTAHA